MKSLPALVMVVATAVIIVFAQRVLVMSSDAFTLFGSENHKVFTYGFPFRIVECSSLLPIHMSETQMGLQYLGNISVWAMLGFLCLGLVRFTKQALQPKRFDGRG